MDFYNGWWVYSIWISHSVGIPQISGLGSISLTLQRTESRRMQALTITLMIELISAVNVLGQLEYGH
jgi:hypothetical protein